MSLSAETALADGRTGVWKFGYGSNMSQTFLRDKKKVNPIRCVALYLFSSTYFTRLLHIFLSCPLTL